MNHGSVTTPDYSLWSLCYAKADMPQDFFGGSGIMSNQGQRPISMNFSLIKGGMPGESHLYLVDCGFSEPSWFKRYPFYDWESPRRVLNKVGVEPEDIEAILITHMHFDHINQLGAFPNAHIYLQRAELEGWSMVTKLPQTFKPGSNPWVYSSFDPADLDVIERTMEQGHVTLLDGDEEVFPGITARLRSRCHTFGSCTWHVATGNGPYIIAGDAVYWYANLENMWPPGYGQGDAFELFFLYDQLKKEVDHDLKRVIPGHDYQIYEKHPHWIDDKNPVGELNLASGQQSCRGG